MAVLGIRQDMSWKLLDQAVISDDTGKVIYNLAARCRGPPPWRCTRPAVRSGSAGVVSA